MILTDDDWVAVGVAGDVEFVRGAVALAVGADDEQPGLLVLRLRVEEFELGVGAAAKLRVGRIGLGTVGVADDLDEAGAAVEFAAEHVAEVAGLGAKDVLPLGLVAFAGKDIGNALARAL